MRRPSTGRAAPRITWPSLLSSVGAIRTVSGEPVEQRAAALQELLAGSRQPQPARVALDQPDREPLLRRAEMAARRRIRHPQRLGGLREAAKLGRFGKHLEL